ncbi:hypothetical protein SAMN05216489_00133 [Streptomyces sp. 3213]|uniref:hypothetical protein n=1 Tax=Streptomyces sp. 3213.3 TaxID=1855348 RepID=UPI0008943824|nr:hypothetical protein [Streptomyces sp. 3213.3]SEC19794.1 hypothetical protein SAMN05216489_00133 [Streptomyces sp. 3213] [Streptomyces sp. 3213.3]
MIESRRLPGDPSGLRLHISYADDLLDTPQGDTLERWGVAILHRGRVHDTARCPGSPGGCVTPDCSAIVVEDVAVGSMTFFRVHLDQRRNAFWAMEEESEKLYEAAQVLLDREMGNFTDDVSELLDYVGSDLLVMDRVTLDKEWRGHGLGAVLAMEAVLRLRPGCRAIACSPGVTDITGNRLRDQAEWDRVNAQIRQGWERIGFRLYRDNVLLLSPTSQVLRLGAVEDIVGELVPDADGGWQAARGTVRESIPRARSTAVRRARPSRRCTVAASSAASRPTRSTP